MKPDSLLSTIVLFLLFLGTASLAACGPSDPFLGQSSPGGGAIVDGEDAVVVAQRALIEARTDADGVDARMEEMLARADVAACELASGWAHLARGEAQRIGGRFQSSIESFDRALDRASDAGDDRLRGLALVGRASSEVSLAQVVDASESLEAASAVLGPESEPADLARLRNAEGVVCQTRFELERAQSLYRQALSHAESAGDEWLQAGLLYNIGTLLYCAGKLPEARTYIELAVLLNGTQPPSHRSALYLAGLAQLESDLGDRAAARAWFDEGEEIARECDAVGVAALCLRKKAELDFEQGRFEEALGGFETSYGLLFDREPNNEALATSAAWAARSLLELGRADEALDRAELARSHSEEIEMPVVDELVFDVLVEARSRVGEFDGVLGVLEERHQVDISQQRKSFLEGLDQLSDEFDAKLLYAERAAQGSLLRASLILGGVAVLFLAAGLVMMARLRHHGAEVRKASAAVIELDSRVDRVAAGVQRLEEMLPICAHCKSIRDEEGEWSQVETYFAEHSGTRFSHGVCPTCVSEHYADLEIAPPR